LRESVEIHSDYMPHVSSQSHHANDDNDEKVEILEDGKNDIADKRPDK